MAEAISAADPHPRKTATVLDSEMSYVDTGEGPAVVLLHGNPVPNKVSQNLDQPYAYSYYTYCEEEGW